MRIQQQEEVMMNDAGDEDDVSEVDAAQAAAANDGTQDRLSPYGNCHSCPSTVKQSQMTRIDQACISLQDCFDGALAWIARIHAKHVQDISKVQANCCRACALNSHCCSGQDQTSCAEWRKQPLFDRCGTGTKHEKAPRLGKDSLQNSGITWSS